MSDELRLIRTATAAGMIRDITPMFYAPMPDMETTNRLADWAKDHLASLTDAEREALEKEFGR
jgi:hypothetical protein